MNVEIHTLPDDIEKLKNIILILNQKYTELDLEYESLKEKFAYTQKMLFGRKSEKRQIDPEDILQGKLFNEAEVYKNEASVESKPDDEKENERITIQQYTRKKSGRKPIDPRIPREEVIHDLNAEEKQCPCCKNERPRIGSEESEELIYIPAKIYVKKHITYKYGPCIYEQFQNELHPEVIAPSPRKRMLPGSIASEELLAHISTSKFNDAIPFYRLENILDRIGVHILRATMCNWVISISIRLEPLLILMKKVMMQSPVIRMDETRIQVLHEKDRIASQQSYIWVAVSYPEDRNRPLVLYEYHSSRGSEVPLKFLEDYRGILQTDGYRGYNLSVKQYGIIHVGCFAHSRREFVKVPNHKTKDSRAYIILDMIGILYKIEYDLRAQNLLDDIFVEKRKKAAMPVLEKLHAYLVECKDVVVPSSALGEAVSYTLNEWHKLIRYLDHAWLTPDNNEIERVIKLFVIGRKNWMFANTASGAKSSASMYSLVQSAKANGLEPYMHISDFYF